MKVLRDQERQERLKTIKDRRDKTKEVTWGAGDYRHVMGERETGYCKTRDWEK